MSHAPATVEPIKSNVFMVLAKDQGGSAEPRQKHLKDHLRFVEANFSAYLVCGPIHGDEGAVVGSFFLVQAESEAAARQIVSQDPYFVCNEVYASVDYQPVTVAAGTGIGGVIWDQSIYKQ